MTTAPLACLALALASACARAGETIPVPVTRIEFGRPRGHDIGGPLPRPLLLVRLNGRGKDIFKDAQETTYLTFDPANPERGFHKIFTGPGDDQSLSFDSPLFGGIGLASCNFDPNKKSGETKVLWYDLLEGKAFPPLREQDIHRERLTETGFLYWPRISGGQDFISPAVPGEVVIPGIPLADSILPGKIVRCNPLTAEKLVSELEFSYVNWLGPAEVLGVARVKNEDRVVRYDMDRGECEVLGGLPEGFPQGISMRQGVYPVGPHCREGVYAIGASKGVALWYLPPGETWHPVIRKVHIRKTFGGAPAWMPVQYLGNGRFAVAKTVRDTVKLPKNASRDFKTFGAAEAVTLQLDGRTGKVIAETKPYLYCENPPLHIPDPWWPEGRKPTAPKKPSGEKPLFRPSKDDREIRFATNGILKLAKDEKYIISSDGRQLVTFREFTERSKGKTFVTFRIADAMTGLLHTERLESPYHEVLSSASWELLCADQPDPSVLSEYEKDQRGCEWDMRGD